MARMRAEDRRRQLLEVAARLFARRGYRGATTAELAKAAGITEPILYRHFRNKLDLFVNLIDTCSEEVISAWQRWLDRARTPTDRLEVLLAGNPSTYERGRDVYRVIFKAMTEHESNTTIAAALRRHVEKLHRFLTAELTLLQEAGIVRRDEPADALASLLIHVATGFGLLQPLGVPGQVEAEGRTNTRRLIHDLLRPN